MIRREVAARYRGSVLGILWSLVTPLLMLAVYTFVFGTVFSGRGWATIEAGAGTASFALILFSGLIPFALFSEVVGKAPGLVVGNRNFVKKVVFPIEILPMVRTGTALVQFGISFVVLLVFLAGSGAGVPPTAIWLPVVVAPFVMLTLGLAWALAALGVYLRDIEQVLPPILSGTLFLSAIFYPLSALPDAARIALLYGNPLVFPIEQIRRVAIYGLPPEWTGLAAYALVATAVARGGHLLFHKMRRGFADVL